MITKEELDRLEMISHRLTDISRLYASTTELHSAWKAACFEWLQNPTNLSSRDNDLHLWWNLHHAYTIAMAQGLDSVSAYLIHSSLEDLRSMLTGTEPDPREAHLSWCRSRWTGELAFDA